MGRILSNILGLPRHAECKTCDEPIAESANQSNKRWQRAPRFDHKVEHNPDGSVNLDGTVCEDSNDGKHHPRFGSLW